MIAQIELIEGLTNLYNIKYRSGSGWIDVYGRDNESYTFKEIDGVLYFENEPIEANEIIDIFNGYFNQFERV